MTGGKLLSVSAAYNSIDTCICSHDCLCLGRCFALNEQLSKNASVASRVGCSSSRLFSRDACAFASSRNASSRNDVSNYGMASVVLFFFLALRDCVGLLKVVSSPDIEMRVVSFTLRHGDWVRELSSSSSSFLNIINLSRTYLE